MIKNWEVRRVNLSDLKPYVDNPRKIKSKNRKSLEASLRRFGYVDFIVWNEETGNIVGGHQRYSILVEDGVKEADVIVVKMSKEEELAANLTLNNPEIEGNWDEPISDLLDLIKVEDNKFFSEAGFDVLEKSIASMVPKGSKDNYKEENKEVDIDGLTSDCDTKCPCCGFEWSVDDKDVSVMTKEEQNALSS
jgi:hypothetical protein